jgi:hypothetical protein
LNSNIPSVKEMQIKSKGKLETLGQLFYMLNILVSVPGTNLSQIQKSKGSPAEKLAEYLLRVHRTVSGASATRPGNSQLSGIDWGATAKIHRTIWSANSARANGRKRNQRATRGLSQRSVGAPDYPVRQEVRGATVGFTRKGRRSGTRQALFLSGGAPDCPVHQPTEGKNGLPNEAPTAPRPLGSIKGTPRRLKQEKKSSQQVYTSFGSILFLPLLYISLVVWRQSYKPLESGEVLLRARAKS